MQDIYDEKRREIEDSNTPGIAKSSWGIMMTLRVVCIANLGPIDLEHCSLKVPPGTGKTSSARLIAKQAGIPLLCGPLEVIMSKV